MKDLFKWRLLRIRDSAEKQYRASLVVSDRESVRSVNEEHF